MRKSYANRILCVIFALSFLLGHEAFGYFGQGDHGPSLGGIRRADKGRFADEMN